MILYHYTCSHGASRIGNPGMLISAATLLADDERTLPKWCSFVWLTDLAVPVRTALGLTRLITTCDRTAFRYRVTDTDLCAPWVDVRRHPAILPWRDELEAAPGAMPRHWYVSGVPVPAVYDERT